MKLEILHASPEPYSKLNKHILFVHGICVGAWVWQEHFMPYFADAGYDVWAVSLRGHGGSEGADLLTDASLINYAEDLDVAVKKISKGPMAVIGHSMGGAVVQRWIRNGGKAQAVGLLSSVPPWGLAAAAFYMGFTAPSLYQELFKMSMLGVESADAEVLRQALFSKGFPDEDFKKFMDRVQDESRRIAVELQGFTPIAPMSTDIPTFVLGGKDDQFIPPAVVRATGSYYRTSSVIVPELAHALMLDKNWQKAADPLHRWLDQTL